MGDLNLSYINELASRFWIKTGTNPTHVLMTVEQQKEFSKTLAPKERFVSPDHSLVDNGLVTLYINPTTILDVLTVVTMRSGSKNNISYPKVIRIEE